MNNYACSSPNFGVKIGLHPSGKPKYKILKREIAERLKKDKYFTEELIPLPCGRCIQCRIRYSRDWAIRCVEEAKYNKYNYFVTLTYDDDHLPRNSFGAPTLKRDDLTKFFKDLRYEYWCMAGKPQYRNDQGVLVRDYSTCSFRYFACGEYGTKQTGTHRSHYHFILFSDLELPLVDTGEARKSHNGRSYKYYSCSLLERVWSDDPERYLTDNPKPKGIVRVGQFNFDTAAYVARYVVKKHKGLDKVFYEDNDLVPEYVVMSRRPGIGKAYYDENKREIYDHDQIIISQKDKVLKLKPPRYYDSLFDVDYPNDMEYVKAVRKFKAECAQKIVETKTDLSPAEYDALRARSLENKISSLERMLG